MARRKPVPKRRLSREPLSRGSRREGPSEAADTPIEAEVAEQVLQRMLGRTNEQIMRAAIGARTRLGQGVPWPELLDRLEPIDPDMATMVRRILAIPSPDRIGPRPRSEE